MTETNTGLGWKDGRRCTKSMAPQDKVDFKLKLLKKKIKKVTSY
jgi:hypothetical protein